MAAVLFASHAVCLNALVCSFTRQDSVKRVCTGIWKCTSCRKVQAGGAYSLNTGGAATVRGTIRRLREVAAI